MVILQFLFVISPRSHLGLSSPLEMNLDEVYALLWGSLFGNYSM